MAKVVIIRGNVLEGFELVGPFDNVEAAHASKIDFHVIADIQTVEEFEKFWEEQGELAESDPDLLDPNEKTMHDSIMAEAEQNRLTNGKIDWFGDSVKLQTAWPLCKCGHEAQGHDCWPTGHPCSECGCTDYEASKYLTTELKTSHQKVCRQGQQGAVNITT